MNLIVSVKIRNTLTSSCHLSQILRTIWDDPSIGAAWMSSLKYIYRVGTNTNQIKANYIFFYFVSEANIGHFKWEIFGVRAF